MITVRIVTPTKQNKFEYRSSIFSAYGDDILKTLRTHPMQIPEFVNGSCKIYTSDVLNSNSLPNSPTTLPYLSNGVIISTEKYQVVRVRRINPTSSQEFQMGPFNDQILSRIISFCPAKWYTVNKWCFQTAAKYITSSPHVKEQWKRSYIFVKATVEKKPEMLTCFLRAGYDISGFHPMIFNPLLVDKLLQYEHIRNNLRDVQKVSFFRLSPITFNKFCGLPQLPKDEATQCIAIQILTDSYQVGSYSNKVTMAQKLTQIYTNESYSNDFEVITKTYLQLANYLTGSRDDVDSIKSAIRQGISKQNYLHIHLVQNFKETNTHSFLEERRTELNDYILRCSYSMVKSLKAGNTVEVLEPHTGNQPTFEDIAKTMTFKK